MVHVPASTKVTSPVEALIVQTDVVELEYCFVPAPADAVEVIVGGVALPAYVALYEPASMVRVRDIAVIVNDLLLELAAA